MNIVVWVVQLLLAVAFLAHGWMFLSPPAGLVDQLNAALPRWFQVFIGAAEVLAAAGLTLPGVTRILPGLVVWAAVGIMTITASATVFHLARGEMSSAATTLILFGIATFVAYARYRVRPIPARATHDALHPFRRPTVS
jgi:putative oxidoreductase